jgi:hypothetical protein
LGECCAEFGVCDAFFDVCLAVEDDLYAFALEDELDIGERRATVRYEVCRSGEGLFSSGVCAVAVPMFDPSGQPAGLALNCASVQAFCSVVRRAGNAKGRERGLGVLRDYRRGDHHRFATSRVQREPRTINTNRDTTNVVAHGNHPAPAVFPTRQPRAPAQLNPSRRPETRYSPYPPEGRGNPGPLAHCLSYDRPLFTTHH